MYLEASRPEIQEFYAKYESDEDLFKSLNTEQLAVCKKYFMQITRYKAEKIEGRSLIVNGYEYMYAICNLTDTVECQGLNGEKEKAYIGYIVKDVTTNKETIVTCDVMDKLMHGRNIMIKSLAESTLLELKYITYLSVIDGVDDFIKDKCKRLALALDDKTIYDKFIFIYKEFYTVYLPLPAFLLDRFNRKVDVQYQKNVFERYIASLTKDMIALKNYKHALTEFGETIIVNSHEHEERMKYAKLLVNYNNAFMKLSNNGKRDLMLFVKSGMQQVYYVHAPNGDRLATKNEKSLLVSACFKKDIFFIAEDKLSLIKMFVWAHTGKFELLTSAGFDTSDYVDNNIKNESTYKILFNEDILEALEKSIDYLMSEEFLQKDIYELSKGLKAIEYLDSAEDEVKDLGLKVKLETIKKECKSTTSSFYQMAYDIAFKALKYNNLVLSIKQMNVINKTYEALVAERGNGNNKFNDELVKMINDIMEYNRYKKGTFMYKLLRSVMDKKRCSIKQYNIIETEYDKIKTMLNCEVDEIGGEQDHYNNIKNKRISGVDDIFVDEDDDSGWYGEDNWDSIGSVIPDITDVNIFE